jgi:hypothetical protein
MFEILFPTNRFSAWILTNATLERRYHNKVSGSLNFSNFEVNVKLLFFVYWLLFFQGEHELEEKIILFLWNIVEH